MPDVCVDCHLFAFYQKAQRLCRLQRKWQWGLEQHAGCADIQEARRLAQFERTPKSANDLHPNPDTAIPERAHQRHGRLVGLLFQEFNITVESDEGSDRPGALVPPGRVKQQQGPSQVFSLNLCAFTGSIRKNHKKFVCAGTAKTSIEGIKVFE